MDMMSSRNTVMHITTVTWYYILPPFKLSVMLRLSVHILVGGYDYCTCIYLWFHH